MSAREAPELGAACIRMFRALARRAGQGEGEALEQLSMLQDSLSMQLGAAVAGYRAFTPAHGAEPYSWTDVARLLGVTRQAAQQRFADATTAPAHGTVWRGPCGGWHYADRNCTTCMASIREAMR